MTVYDDIVQAFRDDSKAAYEPGHPFFVAPGMGYRWEPWQFEREGFGGLRYYSIPERRAWMALPAKAARPLVEILT